MKYSASVAILLWFSSIVLAADTVSYRNEVVALFARSGCNQGACHGKLNGKGGFKLSLRGEDADWDFGVLTRDGLGRRTNRQRPEDSLILQKATASVPHEGGRRFQVGSAEYEILRGWIAAGSQRGTSPRLIGLDVGRAERILVEPADSVPLRVLASFSDGTQRDVT